VTPSAGVRLLAIVPILIDLPAFSILLAIDLSVLAAGDMPVVVGGIVTFLIADLLIFGVELRCLAGVQLAMPEARIDALVLTSQPAVYLGTAGMVLLPFVGVAGTGEH